MAKFIKSAHYFDQYPIDKQFEICVIGRSNVGKSSLINALANKKIARTSNTPGRTQLVNIFLISIILDWLIYRDMGLQKLVKKNKRI